MGVAPEEMPIEGYCKAIDRDRTEENIQVQKQIGLEGPIPIGLTEKGVRHGVVVGRDPPRVQNNLHGV